MILVLVSHVVESRRLEELEVMQDTGVLGGVQEEPARFYSLPMALKRRPLYLSIVVVGRTRGGDIAV